MRLDSNATRGIGLCADSYQYIDFFTTMHNNSYQKRVIYDTTHFFVKTDSCDLPDARNLAVRIPRASRARPGSRSSLSSPLPVDRGTQASEGCRWQKISNR